MARRLDRHGRVNTTGQMGTSGGRRSRLAAALARAAGRAFGRSQASERGTILLMVIGVLAMMSIITVVYVTVGQGDRRQAGALARDARLDDQAAMIADYLSSVIRDDLFSVVFEKDPTGAAGPNPIWYREATDYPWMSEDVRAMPQSGDNFPEFNPAGTAADFPNYFTAPGIYHAGDPFLAASEPGEVDAPTRTNLPATPPYARNVDWPQISNFSPSGLFVNLNALRNNFNAEPGINDHTTYPELSARLTLFDPNTGMPQPPGGTQRLPDGRPAELDIPAHWTCNQIWLHRPAFDLDTTNPAVTGPGTDRYLPYQYADADGDGMFDSRWFELVRWNRIDEEWYPVIRNEGPARLFVAARCIDLTGLINVQTASDFVRGPDGTGYTPIGQTPADIDLRRLLTLTDAYTQYLPQFSEAYEGYQPPAGTGGPRSVADYADTDFDADTARRVGGHGYSALRLAMRDGSIPRREALQADNDPANPASPFILDRVDRPAYFAALANPSSAAYGSTGGGPAFTFARPFGVADELELRTYHGANDSARLSRFEATVAGRDRNPSVTTFGQDVSPHCPVRSNRPLVLERGGRGDRDNFSGPHPFGNVRNGLPDRDALLQAATDIRRLLTFHSGARPLRTVRVENPTDPLTNNDLRVNAVEALEKAVNTPVTQPRGAHDVFRAYVSALLPYVGENATEAWNPSRTDLYTLCYGHRGPELALRIAAHMAVNVIDMYDDNGLAATDAPTAFEVFLRTGGAGGAGGSQIPPGHQRINLDDVMGGTWLTPTGGSAPAIRVYGIEAHPFLTEVGVYTMFTDHPDGDVVTPDTGWTDDEDQDGEPDPGEGPQININGDIDASNPDFLMQVIAFQVYNPFNEPVNMTDFYFEFGDTLFDAAGAFPGGPAGTVYLQPGEHKVFFASTPFVHPNPASGAAGGADARLRSAGADPTHEARKWISKQFDIRIEEVGRYQLRRRDRVTGQLIPEAEVRDMLAPAGDPNQRNSVVMLWRKFPSESTSPTAMAEAERQRSHILIDRMHDPAPPGSSTWDRRWSGNKEIGGTISRGPGQDDDQGISITVYGTVVRPTDSAAVGGGQRPLGAIPAFCIERKPFWDPSAPSLNIGQDDGLNPDTWTKAQFETEFIGSAGAMTLDALLNDQTNNTLNNSSVHLDPDVKTTGLRLQGGASGHTHITFPPLADPFDAFPSRYVEIHLNNKRFRGQPIPPAGMGQKGALLRPADMLLPLGIGPFCIPTASSSIPNVHREDFRWTTLAEALAMATGFDHGPNASGAPVESPAHPSNLYHRLAEDILDRGGLRLEWFVPYVDNVNPTPQSDFSRLPTYDDNLSGSNQDIPRFPAVPFASRIIDNFQTLEHGGLRTAIPGVININTAPLNVLRQLPLLSPDPRLDSWVRSFNAMRLFNQSNPGGGMLAALFPNGSQIYDVAATVKAYRDKALVTTRPSSATGGGGGTTRAIDFRGTRDTTSPASASKGRGLTQIDGLSDEPGFSTPGEILAVQVRTRTATGIPTFLVSQAGGGWPARGDIDNSINRFGFSELDYPNWAQETTANILGIDSTVYEDPLNPGVRKPDEIVNDYDEQLTIANAVLNSITTRSDVFCVWFVVHGYLPSDCEGLGADDPLVPSIARRYVMVVDRSNVTSPTDKPRILLFQEVPM